MPKNDRLELKRDAVANTGGKVCYSGRENPDHAVTVRRPEISSLSQPWRHFEPNKRPSYRCGF
jgi:hypothetical protein